MTLFDDDSKQLVTSASSNSMPFEKLLQYFYSRDENEVEKFMNDYENSDFFYFNKNAEILVRYIELYRGNPSEYKLIQKELSKFIKEASDIRNWKNPGKKDVDFIKYSEEWVKTIKEKATKKNRLYFLIDVLRFSIIYFGVHVVQDGDIDEIKGALKLLDPKNKIYRQSYNMLLVDEDIDELANMLEGAYKNEEITQVVPEYVSDNEDEDEIQVPTSVKAEENLDEILNRVLNKL